MSDNSLLSRLDGIEARFEEVSTLVTDPQVIADMKRYVKLTKEYKELEKLVDATRKYRTMLGNIDEARQMLETENDPEMKAMAREQLDTATAALPELEEQIKILLIPADPEDSKNAIVEIRGLPADIKRLFWPCRATTSMVRSNKKAAYTAYNVSRQPRHKDVSTHRQQLSPFSPKPKNLMSKSTRAKSSGIHSEAVAPEVRTSTKLNRVSASATCGVTP